MAAVNTKLSEQYQAVADQLAQALGTQFCFFGNRWWMKTQAPDATWYWSQRGAREQLDQALLNFEATILLSVDTAHIKQNLRLPHGRMHVLARATGLLGSIYGLPAPEPVSPAPAAGLPPVLPDPQ